MTLYHRTSEIIKSKLKFAIHIAVKLAVIVFILMFATSCLNNSLTEPLDASEDGFPVLSVGSVRVISGGEEHEPHRNWHHGFWPADDGEILSASGISEQPSDVADRLTPIILEEDFQIIIEYEQHSRPSYYFYKLIDDEWMLVLLVYPLDDLIFLVHDWENWVTEEIFAESFMDVLEPGEYILDANVWWSNEFMGSAYQHFFRLIVGTETDIDALDWTDLGVPNEISHESANTPPDDFNINGTWIYTHYFVEDGVQYTYPEPEYVLEISDGAFRLVTGSDGMNRIYEGTLSRKSRYEFLVAVTSMTINEELDPAIREGLVLVYHPDTELLEARSLFHTNEGFSGVDYFFRRWD